MVARTLLGLVRAVLLLVDDDDAEVAHGREHRRARADHDARPAGLDLFEAVAALSGGQRRVQHRDQIAELCGELPQHLRRQSDLRDEHDGALSGLERVRDQAQIDLRLAAARHAEQQRGLRLRLIHERGHAVIRLLLLRGEHGLRRARYIGKVRRTHAFLVFHTQDALFDHIAQSGVARARHVGQLLLAHPDAVRERGHDVLPRGAAPYPAHRFIGLHVEREHFFRLVAGLLHGVAVVDEDALARERIERAPGALSEAFAYLGERKRLSRRVEQAQHLAFLALARVQRRRVCIRGKRVHLVPPEPQSGREHGAHAVEIGTVQPLPHPRGELQLLLRQHRLLIERFHDRLEAVFARVLAKGEHNAFCPFIAKAERHENTGADLHLFPQLVRHTVRI